MCAEIVIILLRELYNMLTLCGDAWMMRQQWFLFSFLFLCVCVYAYKVSTK